MFRNNEKQISDLFKDIFDIDLNKTPELTGDEKWVKSINKLDYPYNIYVLKNGNYVLEVALAGFKKEDISIEVEGNFLILDVEEKPSEKFTGHIKTDDELIERYTHKGIAKRKVHAKFTLGHRVYTEGIKSEFVNGLLKVTIPITKENKKKITIM